MPWKQDPRRADYLEVLATSGDIREIRVDIFDSQNERPDGGSAGRRDFQDFLKILHDEPLIRDVRNPDLPPHVGVEFAQFRPVGWDSHESPPINAEPAGRRVSEPTSF